MRIISEKSLAEKIVDVIAEIKKECWTFQNVEKNIFTANHKGIDFFLNATNCLHKEDYQSLWVGVGGYAFKIDILSDEYAKKLTSYFHSIDTHLSLLYEGEMELILKKLGIICVGGGKYVFK